MCLVLKVMLLQRGLSDPATGGLGGYSLINLIVYYLRYWLTIRVAKPLF